MSADAKLIASDGRLPSVQPCPCVHLVPASHLRALVHNGQALLITIWP